MKTFSEETRRRMSESAKRRAQTSEFLNRVRSYWQPFCSEAELRADYEASMMSQLEICAKWGVSLKRVQTSMRRFGITPRKQIKRRQQGAENAFWKGSDASYTAFHARLYRNAGQPKKCDRCGTTDPSKTYDWANLTGHYDDPSDYQRMCRSCHHRYDRTIKNLGKYAERKEVSNA